MIATIFSIEHIPDFITWNGRVSFTALLKLFLTMTEQSIASFHFIYFHEFFKIFKLVRFSKPKRASPFLNDPSVWEAHRGGVGGAARGDKAPVSQKRARERVILFPHKSYVAWLNVGPLCPAPHWFSMHVFYTSANRTAGRAFVTNAPTQT